MSRIDSNEAEILDALARLPEMLDLADGAGAELLDVLGDRIRDRFLDESGPDGAAFAANRGRYGQEKRARGVAVGIGIDDDSPEMSKSEHFRGEREITTDSAEVAFGADAENAAKGEWFHFGAQSGGRNQVERPFFEADDSDEEAVLDAAEAIVGKQAQSQGW